MPYVPQYKWVEMPAKMPQDLSTIWVRRYWYTTPFLAVWDLSAATLTHAAGLVMPWWAAHRWKDQP